MHSRIHVTFHDDTSTIIYRSYEDIDIESRTIFKMILDTKLVGLSPDGEYTIINVSDKIKKFNIVYNVSEEESPFINFDSFGRLRKADSV